MESHQDLEVVEQPHSSWYQGQGKGQITACQDGAGHISLASCLSSLVGQCSSPWEQSCPKHPELPQAESQCLCPQPAGVPGAPCTPVSGGCETCPELMLSPSPPTIHTPEDMQQQQQQLRELRVLPARLWSRQGRMARASQAGSQADHTWQEASGEGSRRAAER